MRGLFRLIFLSVLLLIFIVCFMIACKYVFLSSL